MEVGATLKHVEKNAHKKNPALAGEIPVPKQGSGPKAVVAKPKKEPKKEFKYNTWYIENWGKEVLKYEGDEDVQPGFGWALIGCQDTTLVVEGKIKTIMLENCHNVRVIVTSIMANIEVLNSKKTTVQIKEQ